MSGGSPAGTSTTTQTLSPEQRQILGQGMPLVSGFTDAYNQGKVQTPQQPGFTPLQEQGQQTVAGAATGAAQGSANAAAKGQQFLAGGNVLDVNNNPALKGYVDAANQQLDNTFQTKVIPSLRTNAVNAGGLGGSRDALGENTATQDYLRERGNTTSQILNTAYGQNLGAMVQGINATPQTIQSEIMPGTALDTVGSEQQQQQLAVNQANYAGQVAPLDYATQLFASLAGLPGGSSTTTTTPAQPTGLLGRILSKVF